jgi:hypothetical protein
MRRTSPSPRPRCSASAPSCSSSSLGFPLIGRISISTSPAGFLASIGSLSLMLLTGHAGLISLGQGLRCAGAHRRHPVQRIQHADLADAAGRPWSAR